MCEQKGNLESYEVIYLLYQCVCVCVCLCVCVCVCARSVCAL